MDNKILVGHDNGRICTFDITGQDYKLHNVSHHDGECWGLEIIPENGTFLTTGDDNQFHEVSIAERKVTRSGTVWAADQNNNGNSYTTNKIRCRVSGLMNGQVRRKIFRTRARSRSSSTSLSGYSEVDNSLPVVAISRSCGR